MSKNNKDIYKNSINGFIIGDALGVPVEFNDREKLKKEPVKEMKGYGTHNQPPGTWSDDTSMILAEMDSIAEKKNIDYYDIMEKITQWAINNKYTATGITFDIGLTTQKAIYKYTQEKEPTRCGGNEIYDNGNGSLMRILPFVIFSIENKLKEEEEVELINKASSLTHANEISLVGCKIYSDIVKMLIQKKTLSEAINQTKKINYTKYYTENSLNYYSKILNGTIINLKEEEIESSGFIVSTLEASIWSLYHSKSYEEAILKAVNLGGDTDTIAAITGSMAGILFGNIPEKWLQKIKNKELIDDIYNKFIKSVN